MKNCRALCAGWILSLLCLPCVIHAGEFHVAVTGDDANPGSLAAPFRTIGKATAVMQSGDRCLIHAGIYRETITPKTDQLSFGPFKEDRVEINGCDVVTESWGDFKGNVKVIPSPKKVWQIFVDGKRIKVARFPDMGDVETLLTTDKDNYLPTEILMPPGPGQSILKFPAVKDFPKDAFVGGIYSGMHGRNSFTSATGLIKAVNDDILTIHAFFSRQWDRQNYTRMGKGTGYIINCLAALTSPMEWYWSEKDKRLYFIPPKDFNSQRDQIELRYRLWGLDLRKRKNIVVEGLHFKAASIRMDDAVGCEVRNCEVLYGSPWTAHKATDYGGRLDASCGVYVSGEKNRLWRNRIAHSWGAGVRLEGVDNTLEQCLIEDIGWLGRRTAGVQAWGLRNHVLRNVIRKVGNSGIDGGQRGFGVGRFGRELDIRFDLVLDIGYLASHDIGMYYVNTQGFREPLKQVIAYNTMFGFAGHMSVNNTPCPAIYTDNGTRGVIAHDNVSDLKYFRRGGESVVFRDNSAKQHPLAPIHSEEGIKKLLNDNSPCPPLDVAAFFDQEIPGLEVSRAGSRGRQDVTLDDRKDYSLDELMKLFPPMERARWERERVEQAKRLAENEKKRLARQKAKEQE
ncbi:hypothetical protein ACFL6U_10330 [Planctomycetota bacterium]